MRIKRVLVRVSIALGALVVLFVVVVLISIAPRLSNMKSEYNTATVIRKTEVYVRDHHGQWPRTWANLGLDNQDALTTVNFELNPKTATEADVLTSIHPPNGKYYTFPHSKWMLENLYSTMTNAMRQAEQTGGGDGIPPPHR